MQARSGEQRALIQELYLQDFTTGIYAVYRKALRDAEGRRLLDGYLGAEAERRRRIEDHLGRAGVPAAPWPGRLFGAAGRFYGRVTSLLGTRAMLRIVLSASRRASRRACARLGPADRPDLAYLGMLRARNVGELHDALQQHLIDTRASR
jgi:hypothetical protein